MGRVRETSQLLALLSTFMTATNEEKTLTKEREKLYLEEKEKKVNRRQQGSEKGKRCVMEMTSTHSSAVYADPLHLSS